MQRFVQLLIFCSWLARRRPGRLRSRSSPAPTPICPHLLRYLTASFRFRLPFRQSTASQCPWLPRPVLPRMAPEFALQVCRGRSVIQTAQLASYSATTLIRAQLPDTAQSGEYEVQQRYLAPRTLAFKSLRFTGDAFVKTNVIIRLLQSEVDHVQKDDPALNAISPANYKFSYKGTSQWEGRTVHAFQVKPRQKRAGLFKGRIFVDAYTGSLVRAEGRPVKAPSLFIKKIDFVQDYADIGPFTFPVHIHSEASARIVGRAIVDVYQRDYQPVANTVANTTVTAKRTPSL